VPIPAKSEAVLGGHCTWFFGFNSTYQEWTAPSGRRYPPRCKASRNSWRNADGSWWGNNGDFFMPLWFFDPTNGPQATDFWVIQRIGVAA
jgi:C1A family cysteine protease